MLNLPYYWTSEWKLEIEKWSAEIEKGTATVVLWIFERVSLYLNKYLKFDTNLFFSLKKLSISKLH